MTSHDQGREPRCPRCGGLVAPGAQWCGQCFQRLEDDAPGRQPETPPQREARPRPAEREVGGPFEVEGERILWDCPTCGSTNPIEASACERCGAPFARLMESAEEPAPPKASPGRAMGLSLVFPGLGHISAGKGAEGAARAVLFAWVLGTLLALLVVRSGQGLGPYAALATLYVIAALLLYVVTAADARRAAEGAPPVVTSRVLLYGVTGLMLVTVVALFVVGLRVTR